MDLFLEKLMILSGKSSFLRKNLSESRDLVAARVSLRALLSRIDAVSQSLRNEIAHRVVQEIGRGAEEIPEDVKELRAEAAHLEYLRSGATRHLEEIDQFAKILSGEIDLSSSHPAIVNHGIDAEPVDRRSQLLIIESAGIFAYGCVSSDGFRVGRGSLYRKEATPSLFHVYLEERSALERDGVVAKDARGKWVFQRDHLFRAPGVAAMVTFGVAKSGNAWAPVTRQRVLSIMARHGIEADPGALAQFGMSDYPGDAAVLEIQASSQHIDISPRTRHLRKHALQGLAPGARDIGGGCWESEDARVLSVMRSGQSPWKFQIQRSALNWVLEERNDIHTRSVLFICGERGFVPLRAQDIEKLIAGQWAKPLTEKAYAVISMRVGRGDQMRITLTGTSRSLRNPAFLRE